MERCEARQYSDQMNCARCGLVWDVNDPDEPTCPKIAAERAKRVQAEYTGHYNGRKP